MHTVKLSIGAVPWNCFQLWKFSVWLFSRQSCPLSTPPPPSTMHTHTHTCRFFGSCCSFVVTSNLLEHSSQQVGHGVLLHWMQRLPSTATGKEIQRWFQVRVDVFSCEPLHSSASAQFVLFLSPLNPQSRIHYVCTHDFTVRTFAFTNNYILPHPVCTVLAIIYQILRNEFFSIYVFCVHYTCILYMAYQAVYNAVYVHVGAMAVVSMSVHVIWCVIVVVFSWLIQNHIPSFHWSSCQPGV